MLYAGIDVGTTTVSAILLDAETGKVDAVISKGHEAAMESTVMEEDIQDPEKIVSVTNDVIDELISKAGGCEGVGGICFTGQVHGILYMNGEGRAVSPFYTWQDQRARLPRSEAEEDWVTWIRKKTGRKVPAGYGLLTHCINEAEGKVPPNTVYISSILDYLSMKLGGNNHPFTDPTNAHALGFYENVHGNLNIADLQKIGINPALLPEIIPPGSCIGSTKEGIPVVTSIGDNQAGFYGAVTEPEHSILLNIGTSAQMSVLAERDHLCTGKGQIPDWMGKVEVRPYVDNNYILTGASLAGGSAYRLLERFFREVCKTFCGNGPDELFDVMNTQDLSGIPAGERLEVTTHFYGTREDHRATGSVKGIGKNNFRPFHLIDGFIRGVVNELYDFYQCLPTEIRRNMDRTVGVGNGMKKNPHIQRMVKEIFDVPLFIPDTDEEAALGAAWIASNTLR